jgi:hypothetical protein
LKPAAQAQAAPTQTHTHTDPSPTPTQPRTLALTNLTHFELSQSDDRWFLCLIRRKANGYSGSPLRFEIDPAPKLWAAIETITKTDEVPYR